MSERTKWFVGGEEVECTCAEPKERVQSDLDKLEVVMFEMSLCSSALEMKQARVIFDHFEGLFNERNAPGDRDNG